MSVKQKCPFFNVGYCKHKDKCSNEHNNVECLDNECKDKNCAKRHRRQCRHGSICFFLKKNKCEYKHNQTKFMIDNQAKKYKKRSRSTQNRDLITEVRNN